MQEETTGLFKSMETNGENNDDSHYIFYAILESGDQKWRRAFLRRLRTSYVISAHKMGIKKRERRALTMTVLSIGSKGRERERERDLFQEVEKMESHMNHERNDPHCSQISRR